MKKPNLVTVKSSCIVALLAGVIAIGCAPKQSESNGTASAPATPGPASEPSTARAQNDFKIATPIFLGSEDFLKEAKKVPKMQKTGEWVTRDEVMNMVGNYIPRVQNATNVHANLDTEKLLIYIDGKMLKLLMDKAVVTPPNKCVGVAAMLAVDRENGALKNQTFVLMPYDTDGKILTLDLVDGIQYAGAERWPGHESIRTILTSSGDAVNQVTTYYNRIKR